MAREEMKSEKPNLAEPVSGAVPPAARHVPTGGLEFLNSQTRSAFPPDPIHWADRASKQNMRNPMKKDETRCRYPVGKTLPPEKGWRVAKGIIGEKERPRRRTLGSFCRNVRFSDVVRCLRERIPLFEEPEAFDLAQSAGRRPLRLGALSEAGARNGLDGSHLVTSSD